jgi:hypothetical protein
LAARISNQTMSLQAQASAFFADLAEVPRATTAIAPFPVDVQIVTPDAPVVIVQLRDGALVAVETGRLEGGYWKLELDADQRIFELIFEGALTMGEAFYAGHLRAPEEKPKHNITCALSWAVCELQTAHRRAGARNLLELKI